MVVKLSWLNS